ncbi:hypothetical protein [Paenibacillus sp. P32E]|uniref:DUF7352 domain-containing protein n=1 Tax=Paenibacillus sp. P32E TaxID=1349434 RepID=UPI00093E69D2|nr:hypothetical protein [Paenibacillus sp. P32E]OKP94799.1 hypothetical protein A3848_02165 [Paenibacillus sp. P32E]
MQHSVIHKYFVDPSPDVQTLQVSAGSSIISAVNEGGYIAVYVLKQNPNQPMVEDLKFLVVGTGWDITCSANAKFISTVKVGEFVWHLFAVSELPF